VCQLISKKPGDPGGIGKLGRLAAEVRCFFTQLQSLTLIDPGYGESWETYDTALYRWHVAKNGGSLCPPCGVSIFDADDVVCFGSGMGHNLIMLFSIDWGTNLV